MHRILPQLGPHPLHVVYLYHIRMRLFQLTVHLSVLFYSILLSSTREAATAFVVPKNTLFSHTNGGTKSGLFGAADPSGSSSSDAPTLVSQISVVGQDESNNNEPDLSIPETPASKASSEWRELQEGWREVVTGEAFDTSQLYRLWTVEDVIGIVIHFPLLWEALRTAVTGHIGDGMSYMICAAASLMTSAAHAKMSVDIPRDYRAPRLAEFHTVYEFSALYLVPFAWLLYRISPIFPVAWEQPYDILGALALTVITIYGVAYAVWGKTLLTQANTDSTYQGILQPSSVEYQTQAQLYLTGNIIINSLACLFIPFTWKLTFRGTEWWDRVQDLHPNQAAFLGVSILVAILGDVSGNLLLRLQELKIVDSPRALVVMGITSNVLFLLFPELVFNTIYIGGVSEIGFYWE
jgi:hypothetical protein